MSSVLDTAKRQILVALFDESATAPIRYTLDGTDPSVNAPAYTTPFVVEKTLDIRAVSVRDGQLLSTPTTHRILFHKAVARPVSLKYPYQKYTAGGPYGLTNGLCGTKFFDDGNWQGYEQNDFDATVDLGEVMPVSKVTVHFLQDHHSWIFAPTAVQYDVSEDGVTFVTVGSFALPPPTAAQETSILELSQVTNTRARFVRVFARNLGTCPSWHAGRGGKAWLFLDEIIVE